MQMDSRSQISIHDLLDSTTLEVGFDHTCLEGLTGDLLYSPVDAFAQSCYETLFPEHHHHHHHKQLTPTCDPPSYTPYPELYNIPEQSQVGAATGPVRSDDESYLQVEEEEDDSSDAGSVQNEPGACFWDDSDASAEYPETVSSDKHSDASIRFGSAKNRPITNRSLTDNDFLGGMVVPHMSGSEWEKTFISWQKSLPGHVEVEVDLGDAARSRDSQQKKVGRIAALRAKIPPIRTSSRRTTLYNPRS
jgi:hypothetical protein